MYVIVENGADLDTENDEKTAIQRVQDIRYQYKSGTIALFKVDEQGRRWVVKVPDDAASNKSRVVPTGSL